MALRKNTRSIAEVQLNISADIISFGRVNNADMDYHLLVSDLLVERQQFISFRHILSNYLQTREDSNVLAYIFVILLVITEKEN